jgi:hypothetical protein
MVEQTITFINASVARRPVSRDIEAAPHTRRWPVCRDHIDAPPHLTGGLADARMVPSDPALRLETLRRPVTNW